MNKFILVVPSYNDCKYILSQNYLEHIKNCDIPYYISDYNLKNIDIEKIGGILLTGGGDLSEKYLNEKLHIKANSINEKRDEFEINLVKKAYEKNIPIIGICRGAQIINVALGGTILQHIEGHIQKEDRQIETHKVKILKNSNLYQVLQKEEISVNSIHHQVIKNVPTSLKVSGYSEDNYIEAIEDCKKEKFVLGLQWHPEALMNKDSKKIFETFTIKVYNFINNS